MEYTDEQLAEDSLRGHEPAFAELVSRYVKPLYRFVLQFVHDQDTAEDLVQETFVKAWKHLSRFDRTKKFKTWIFTIAKRTTYDFLKKKKTLSFVLFADEEGKNVLENEPDQLPSAEDILDQETTAEQLAAAVGLLTPTYRTLLLLRYQEDFSLAEIAEILHEPYNTIKSRHQRALKSLKQEYQQTTASKPFPRA